MSLALPTTACWGLHRAKELGHAHLCLELQALALQEKVEIIGKLKAKGPERWEKAEEGEGEGRDDEFDEANLHAHLVHLISVAHGANGQALRARR